ncbi:MAG TPA: helix-turn-helix transcriptional regulator [Amycolatopsis sp.]|nr:helix-turn-helix transcriptional regulator [Amycolatopsis sp.]
MPPLTEKPPLNPFVGALGAKLRQWRIDRDFTLEELTELADVDASYIGRIERGDVTAGITHIVRIVRALGADFTDLMDGLPDPPPQRKRGRRGPSR